MWLEAKMMLSGIAIIFIAIVLSQIILLNMLLGFLLIVGIGLVFFSEIIIGYQVSRNHVNVLMDPMPPGYELCVLFDFSGNIDFLKVKKGPLGTREFVKYKKEANIINKGDYQIRCINGNHGFIGHENYPENINLLKAEALDKLPGDDIKEIVDKLPMEKIDK
jgi:hypothetical protein